MITENKDQLIDIYDIWYEPFWQQGWLNLFKMVFIVFIVGVLFYYLYKKYIKKQIVIDCAKVAYHDLDLLKNFHIATKRDSKDCYFSLSLIIKNYLGSRYHVILSKRTDKEVILHAANYMTDENLELLQQILQGMVFVKFEHEVAATKKLEKDIAMVQEFIQNTTPQQNTKEN